MSLISTLRDLWDRTFAQQSSYTPSPGGPNIPTGAITTEQTWLAYSASGGIGIRDSRAIAKVRYVPYAGRPGFGDVFITFQKHMPKTNRNVRHNAAQGKSEEYRYPNVPEQEFKDFIGSGGSAGKEFHRRIKQYSVAV